MKHLSVTVVALLSILAATAQQQKYFSAAVFNTQNAMPFGKFGSLFRAPFHPGIELGYGKVMHPRTKHEWFGELKFAYFFHRFVQHGFPLYFNFGYRYKINNRFAAETYWGRLYALYTSDSETKTK